MDYSLGFVFDGLLKNVVLISKTKPAWQKGLLNGVGGKLEPGEHERACMVREFKEETGVDVPRHRWVNLGKMGIPGGAVYLYYAVDQFAYDNAKSTTEEEIVHVHVDKLSNFVHVDNLSWLIPAAIDHYKNSGFSLEVSYA